MMMNKKDPNFEIVLRVILYQSDVFSLSVKPKYDIFLIISYVQILVICPLPVCPTTILRRIQALTDVLGKVLDDHSLVKYLPLDITDEDKISNLFMMIDNTTAKIVFVPTY